MSDPLDFFASLAGGVIGGYLRGQRQTVVVPVNHERQALEARLEAAKAEVANSEAQTVVTVTKLYQRFGYNDAALVYHLADSGFDLLNEPLRTALLTMATNVGREPEEFLATLEGILAARAFEADEPDATGEPDSNVVPFVRGGQA